MGLETLDLEKIDTEDIDYLPISNNLKLNGL